MPISVQISENCLNTGNPPRLADAGSVQSLRTLLRQSTADQHAELDADVSALVSEHDIGYISFLRASAAALIPIEHALEAAHVASMLPDWSARTRRRALIRDLIDLGESADAPLCFPAIETEAFGFGVLYVLEGSRLGAPSLARLLSEQSSSRISLASRYLNHGTGQRLWPTFLQYLEQAQPVRNAPRDAIAGARLAFATFSAAYSKVSRT